MQEFLQQHQLQAIEAVEAITDLNRRQQHEELSFRRAIPAINNPSSSFPSSSITEAVEMRSGAGTGSADAVILQRRLPSVPVIVPAYLAPNMPYFAAPRLHHQQEASRIYNYHSTPNAMQQQRVDEEIGNGHDFSALVHFFRQFYL